MNGFDLLPARRAPVLSAAPYDRWLSEDGEVAVTFHRKPGGFVVRFLDICDFDIEAASLSVSCTPDPETEPEVVQELYLNQIVPLILGYKGELVLHGSGVVTPSGAVGFIGMSGRGKSTLAAAFSRQGYPFLTDDGLVLIPDGTGYLVRPNNARFRLFADSEKALLGTTPANRGEQETGKRAIPASLSLPFQEVPVGLRAVYLLGTGAADAPRIKSLNPSEALAALIQHSFILDVEDRERMRGHFDRIAEFAISQPCFMLDFPRCYDYLPRVIAGVLEHAGSGGF